MAPVQAAGDTPGVRVRRVVRRIAAIAIVGSLVVSAAAALPLGGSVPPSTDLMASLIAPLPSNPPQWSSELIATARTADPGGTHRNFLDAPWPGTSGAAYEAAYCHNCTNLPSANSAWAFSSGVPLPDKNQYLFVGGGHSNSPSSDVQVFNIRQVTWNYTDSGAMYDLTGASIGSSCPNVPFQSNDPSGYRIWCNSNNRFAPPGAHTYKLGVYSPALGKVFVEGAFTWQSGQGVPGGMAAVMVGSGQWEDPPTTAQLLDFQSHIAANGTGAWVTGIQCSGCTTSQIFRHGVSTAGAPGANELVDPLTGTVTTLGGGGSGNGDDCGSTGTVIPDPVNGAPFKAFVATFYSTCGPNVADTGHATLQPKINAIPGTGSLWQAYAYANTMPGCGSGGAVADGNENWLYMGDLRVGSNQIVVFNEDCTGTLLILDISNPASWTWSSVSIGGTQPPGQNTNNGGPTANRFFYDPTHDMFFYWVNDGTLYGFKRPPQVT